MFAAGPPSAGRVYVGGRSCYRRYVVVRERGDSRAVVCRDGVAIPLSFDHKPNSEIESTRITKAGGFVGGVNGFFRVNGNLNLSRSIGDLKYKQSTDLPPRRRSSRPSPTCSNINWIPKTSSSSWPATASGTCSPTRRRDFVRTRIQAERGAGREPQLSKICEAVFDRVHRDEPARNQAIGGDNMTCVVVLVGR